MNILLYFFEVFFLVDFFGYLEGRGFGFFKEGREKFGFGVVPEEFDVFKFDEGGEYLIIILEEIVDVFLDGG